MSTIENRALAHVSAQGAAGIKRSPARPASKRPVATSDATAAVAPLICNHIVIRKATRQLGQLFDGVMDSTDLKATQCGLLMQIEAMRSPTMKDLAKALVMDLSALGHTLKPLIRDGFVELVPDAADRRSKRVALTAGGTEKLVVIKQLWHEATLRFETALGVERAVELRAVLSFIASETFGDAFREARLKPARISA